MPELGDGEQPLGPASPAVPAQRPQTCLGHVVLVDTRQPPVPFQQRPLVGIAGDPLLLQAQNCPLRVGQGLPREGGVRGAPGGRDPTGMQGLGDQGGPGGEANPQGPGSRDLLPRPALTLPPLHKRCMKMVAMPGTLRQTPMMAMPGRISYHIPPVLVLVPVSVSLPLRRELGHSRPAPRPSRPAPRPLTA